MSKLVYLSLLLNSAFCIKSNDYIYISSRIKNECGVDLPFMVLIGMDNELAFKSHCKNMDILFNEIEKESK